MATNVIMPALGVAQEKGTLINWLKAEGQNVTKGEPLMEVETDKATVEIEAPASGVLANVTASPGDEIPVGNKIALILAPGEKAETVTSRVVPALSPGAAAEPESTPPPLSSPALAGEDEGGGSAKVDAASGVTKESHPLLDTSSAPVVMIGSKTDKILASPAARRVAREKGIELATLRGSGPDGAILAADVAGSVPAEAPARGGPPRLKETVQLTPMRRIVGERMIKSKQSAPHFYLSMDVDMTEITRKRSALKTAGDPVVPSINDYIVAASARALREFPTLNAAFTDKGVEVYGDINLGVAVAIEDGLVVPVIRNADRLSLVELAKQSRALAEKAQKKKLLPLDYQGGTFTVSNLLISACSAWIILLPLLIRRNVPFLPSAKSRRAWLRTVKA
jgi:pyruvate dehydrogenase E2 component (dihydrolipoamide acetyltransferase)